MEGTPDTVYWFWCVESGQKIVSKFEFWSIPVNLTLTWHLGFAPL